MLTLWSTIIQNLISSTDLSSLRLGRVLLNDDMAFTSWVYLLDPPKWLNLPEWEGYHSLYYLFSGKDINHYYYNYEDKTRLKYLQECRKKYEYGTNNNME